MSEDKETPGEIGQDSSEQGKVISRRGFLKGAGALFATGMLARSGSREVVSSPEVEDNPQISIVDIFGAERFRKRVLDQYFGQRAYSEEVILEGMGVGGAGSLEELTEGVPREEDETFVFMVKALELYWHDHGEQVSGVRKKVERYFGNPSKEVDLSSIVSTVGVKGIELDELGNPIIWLNISLDGVQEVVGQTKGEVVNMSFEVGEVGFKYVAYKSRLKYPEMARQIPSIIKGPSGVLYRDYQGNDISEEEYNELTQRSDEKEVFVKDKRYREFWPVDGYFGERAYQNLANVAKIAQQDSDRIFVAAAGNPSAYSLSALPDIREAKSRLEEEGNLPGNLFMVGVYGTAQSKKAPLSRGADFYVWQLDLQDEIGVNPTASHATAFVTEVVAQLRAGGIDDPDEIRKELYKLSNNEGVYEDEPVWVLDVRKIKERLRS